jgi:hypothetical protein
MLGAATAAVAHSGREESQVAVSGATERMLLAVNWVSMSLSAWAPRAERARRAVVVRRDRRGIVIVVLRRCSKACSKIQRVSVENGVPRR